MVGAEQPAAPGEGVFAELAGVRRVAARPQGGGGAVEQPGHVLLNAGEGAVRVGGDEDMGQKLAPEWPRWWVVPRIVRDRGAQQSYRMGGQALVLKGLSAQDRAEQPMQLHGGRLD